MSTFRFLRTAALLIPALAIATASPAGAADPFYTRLYERGLRDLARGQIEEAQTKLRTACFGFLDEPLLLAEGLMQLGRAQSLAGNTAALADTAERLVDLEDRFDAYSKFEGALKTDFEAALQSALPKDLLRTTPLFAHLAVVAEPTVDRSKPPTARQLRKARARQAAANPGPGASKPAEDVDVPAGAEVESATGEVEPLTKRQLRKARARQAGGNPRPEASKPAEDIDVPAGAEVESATDRVKPLTKRQLRKARARRAVAVPEIGTPVPAQEPDVPAAAPSVAAAARPSIEGTDPGVAETRTGLMLEGRMRGLRAAIAQSRFREQLEEAQRQAVALADEYPESTEAQYLAAEIAYLSADWPTVAKYFHRGGTPPADQPELLFYLSVATYELGDTAAAASMLEAALPGLPRSAFVESYIARILSSPPS